ncbi:MAG: processing protein [Patescibacteria group bacterium]|jgi:DNA processing protein|nr:processing protein [Patescibacteria group bacterium]
MIIKNIVINKDKRFSHLGALPQPVRELFYRGEPLEELISKPLVAIVGSRKVSQYGRHVTASLATELAKAGVVIVSGLALGVDSIAHQAALDAGGTTIAILPCGIDKVYPSSHFHLANRILQQGGALVSEYPPGSDSPMKYQFIARNRIIAGLSLGVVITEAAQNSGSLHTAEFALEQGKEVFAVPGNITSATSSGTNNLIKNGAVPVTEVSDIYNVLGISAEATRDLYKPKTKHEAIILRLISQDYGNTEILQLKSSIDPINFNMTLTELELNGVIAQTSSGKWIMA